MANENVGTIKNKIAVITGGSRGLGRNTAVNLARRSVDIIFTYRVNQKEAEPLIREIEALGRKPGRSVYGPTKGAVEVLTRYLAKELGPRRITVNVVAPGTIATDFSGGVVRDNPEVNKHVAEMTA